MNTILPIFIFSILIIVGVIGIIYTAKNNEKFNEMVFQTKLIAQYRNLKISDTETLKMSFWKGNLKIYENILIIENGTYYHYIILDEKKIKKQTMTIKLEKMSIEKNTLVLHGIKHRVFGKSNVKIRIKSNNENEIFYIYKAISNRII